MIFNTIINNKSLKIEFSEVTGKLIIKNKKKSLVDYIQISENSYSVILNGKSFHLTIYSNSNEYEVIVNHYSYKVKIKDELDLLIDKIGVKENKSIKIGQINAHMPGLITKIFVKKGEKIIKDQKLFILEAMKMENEIYSPINGYVNNINYKIGDTIEKGNIIMDIEN